MNGEENKPTIKSNSSLVGFLVWQLRSFIFATLVYILVVFILMPILAWLSVGEWRWPSISVLLKLLRVTLAMGVIYGAGNWFFGRLGELPLKKD